MIEADRADHSRAKLDHDLIMPITNRYYGMGEGLYIGFYSNSPKYQLTPQRYHKHL